MHRIVIRNIATSAKDQNTVTTRSVDDNDIPETLNSPEKLLALDESEEFTRRSHSSVDLRRNGFNSPGLERSRSPDQIPEPLKIDATRRSRPRAKLLHPRRRSTLEWSHTSSQQRQTRLEQLAETRLVKVFFSLHVDDVRDPVYVSEIAHDAINPDFCRIELDTCGPSILRSDTVMIKLWVKQSVSPVFTLLSQTTINLRHLTFIGNKLADYRPALPQNCIVVELTDGLYVAWADVAVGDRQRAPSLGAIQTNGSDRNSPASSSFDALLRLSKLDDSIQDALTLRQKLKNDLDRTVDAGHLRMADADTLQQAKDFYKTVEYAKMRLQKQLQTLRKSRDQAKQSLNERHKLLERGRTQHVDPSSVSGLDNWSTSVPEQNKSELQISIVQQRRRICEALQRIYPIAPIPNHPLSFTIRDLHLPNSEDLEGASPEQIGGALGHVAHAVQLLALYLAQPLLYPVWPRSGTSTIHDPISVMGADIGNFTGSSSAPISKAGARLNTALRIFPLYPRGVPRFRFEYGVFLLNKNIELLLSNVYRVRVLDIRQTLPNLLYVLYCATAGAGELPARKAGGIRGLLRAGRASFDNHNDNAGAAEGVQDDVPVQSFRFGSQAAKKRGSKLVRDDWKGTL